MDSPEIVILPSGERTVTLPPVAEKGKILIIKNDSGDLLTVCSNGTEWLEIEKTDGLRIEKSEPYPFLAAIAKGEAPPPALTFSSDSGTGMWRTDGSGEIGASGKSRPSSIYVKSGIDVPEGMKALEIDENGQFKKKRRKPPPPDSEVIAELKELHRKRRGI